MNKFICFIFLIITYSNSEIKLQRFDNYAVALRHLYNCHFLEAYYEFNYMITRFPNFHLNHKSNFYAATCLRYFGQYQESLMLLDASENFAGIKRDSNPDPFVWLARSDTMKALSCFRNIGDYPFNNIFNKYFNQDIDLSHFICLINFNSYDPPGKKSYISIEQKYNLTSKKYEKWRKKLIRDPLIQKAFDEIVQINCNSDDTANYKINNLKDLMAILIAKAIYYNSIEDYSRCEMLLNRIILSFPYLFQIQSKRLPDDIMDQIKSQQKRLNLLKFFPSHKALQEMIEKKETKFSEIGKVAFTDISVYSIFENLLVVVSENNKHLKNTFFRWHTNTESKYRHQAKTIKG